jgi:hypothetical protein
VLNEFESLPEEWLVAVLQRFENPFKIWSGNIDLLAMSQQLTPEWYRRYIDLAREWRRRHPLKAAVPQSEKND